MNRLFNLLFIIVLMTPFYTPAELKVIFNEKAVEQVRVNDVWTKEAILNLETRAYLTNENDIPGLKLILGYEFFCEGDDINWKNRDQEAFVTNTLIGANIVFDKAIPNRWDQWPSGSKPCMMVWTGAAHRTKTESGITITSTISGFGSSIAFTYPPDQSSEPDSRFKSTQKIFTMIKPGSGSSSGEVCHQPF